MQPSEITFENSLVLLSTELDRLVELLAEMSEEDWTRPTRLVPPGDGTTPWNVMQLVSHINISIGLTFGLLDTLQDGQAGRDRVSFFIANRSEVAPVVYGYAVAQADGHTPQTMLEQVKSTFTASLERSRATAPEAIGSGYFALMRLDEWIPTRVVEAVVHGMDVSDSLDLPPVATAAGVQLTAHILDDLLARKTVAGRPADMADDLAWVRAASGRGPHPDPRLPLIV